MKSGPRSTLAASAWAVTAAFGAYFCMYAFRKPFTAADYERWPALWGVGSYKVLLVACQVFGYTVSKFIGIKVISEMPPQRRAAAFALLIGLAQLALVLFAVLPPAWGLLCLFFNGLALGMVFGLVLGFLEGRRVTEALTAGLCASFILADGVVKSVGDWVLALGVSEAWMPATAGALFLLPQASFVWMLTRIPPPAEEDVVARSERAPMNGAERWEFFWKFAPGLVLLVGVYLLLTVLRSLRSDFAKEMWQALGWDGQPMVFTYSEAVVMVGVVLINGAAVLIVDNRRAFHAALCTSMLGFALLALGAVGYQAGLLGGFAFMVLAGLGLYVPYVAVHTTIFERLIALLRARGNLGYLMYLADAFGYLGYVAVMVIKNFGAKVPKEVLLDFFVWSSWAAAAAAAGLTALAGWYFAARTARLLPDVSPVPRPGGDIMSQTATEKPFRVGVFRSANDAGMAIEALLAAGLSRDELAVVCSDKCDLRFKDIPQPKPDNSYSAEAIGIGTAAGAVLGGISLAVATAATGGLAALGAGTVLVGGGAIAGAFVGAMSRRVSEKELGPYFEQAVRADSILVAAEAHGEGSAEKLARAERILAEFGGEPLALPQG